MGVPGLGLAQGLAVTLRRLASRAHTRQYPDVKPALPPRSRGVIALVEENCTVCMLCARECPDWCIYIDSHKETVEVPGAARARQRNVLDRFAIDFSLCMYCGICIEVCPFDALFWSPEFEYAEYDIRELLHERPRLREWVATVPPPPAHDPNAEPAKEVTAAARALEPAQATPGRSPEEVPAGERPVRRQPANVLDEEQRVRRPAENAAVGARQVRRPPDDAAVGDRPVRRPGEDGSAG